MLPWAASESKQKPQGARGPWIALFARFWAQVFRLTDEVFVSV